MRKLSNEERVLAFWDKVNKFGPLPPQFALEQHSDIKGKRCWLWAGSRDNKGYGNFGGRHYLLKGERLTHRISFKLHNPNTRIDALQVCHKCDNPGCLRPSHLFVGTGLDNVRDMYAKNKQPLRFGEFNGNSKLTCSTVLKIRKLHKTGKYTFASLGRKFDISGRMTSLIISRKAWDHV